MDVSAQAGWFYSSGTERKGPYSKDQISVLMDAGVLTAHSKVWSETLDDWTPVFRTELRAFLKDQGVAPPEITPPEPQLSSQPPVSAPYASVAPVTWTAYDNRTLGALLSWVLYAFVLIELLTVGLIFKTSSFAGKAAIVAFSETMTRLPFWQYRWLLPASCS